MSEKKENREEGKEQSSFRSGLTDEQIEAALNACTFGYLREKCRNCPLDSEKEPCMTNLHLAALEYIGRLKKRADVAERALCVCAESAYAGNCEDCFYFSKCDVNSKYCLNMENAIKNSIVEAEKELTEEGKDENI